VKAAPVAATAAGVVEVVVAEAGNSRGQQLGGGSDRATAVQGDAWGRRQQQQQKGLVYQLVLLRYVAAVARAEGSIRRGKCRSWASSCKGSSSSRGGGGGWSSSWPQQGAVVLGAVTQQQYWQWWRQQQWQR
jgi:hypothetical protein